MVTLLNNSTRLHMLVVFLIVSSVKKRLQTLKKFIKDISDAKKQMGVNVLTTYVLNATSMFQLASENVENFPYSMIMIKDKKQPQLTNMILE